MSSETTKGLTYEEAHNAKPVGYIFEARTTSNDLAKSIEKHITLGERQNPNDVNVYHQDVVATLKGQVSELQEQLSGHKQAYESIRAKYEAERQRQFTEAGWFFPATWITDEAAESLNHLIERTKQASVTNITVAPGQPYEIQYEGDWLKYGFAVLPSAMPVGGGSITETEFRIRLCEALNIEGVPSDDAIVSAVVQAVQEYAQLFGSEGKVTALFDAIKHGDEGHQTWLKEAIAAFFKGDPVPPVVMKASDEQAWVVKLGSAIARYNNPRVINGISGEKLEELYKSTMEQIGMPNSHSLLAGLKQLVNELMFDSALLLDIVQLVCGNKKESEVFWGNSKTDTFEPPLYTIATTKLLESGDGTQPGKVEKLLGRQAGISYYKNGRLYIYNMGDTIARQDVPLYPVYFEEGKMPPEMSPMHVTKEQVALTPKAAEMARSWINGAPDDLAAIDAPTSVPSFYQNARRELDCTSCPMQPILEGCCKGIRSSTGPQAMYEQALARYTDSLEAALDAYCSESMFKSSPEFMGEIRDRMRNHYLTCWKKENPAPVEQEGVRAPTGIEPGVQDNSVKKHLVNAAPLTSELGINDTSAKKKPFFTEAQLKDKTLLQIAIVMGMAGTQAQQDEARVFLTQYLAINTNLHAAADAYIRM